MPHRTYKDKYEAQSKAFESYEIKSKWARRGYSFARLGFWSFFLIPLCLSILGYEASVITDSSDPIIRGTFTVFGFFWFFTPFIWLYTKFILNRIQTKHDYPNIKKEFVFAYQAIDNYNDYIDNPQRTVSKEKAKTYIKKTFSFIRKWDYGNIKIILNNYKEKIDFIRNNLQSLLKNKVESDPPKYQNEAYSLLLKLMKFLYENDDSSLNSLYNESMKYYEDYGDNRLYIYKKMMRNFVLEHKFSSYVIAIAISIISYTIFNLIMNVSMLELRREYLTLIGIIILLFEAFKKYYLEIE